MSKISKDTYYSKHSISATDGLDISTVGPTTITSESNTNDSDSGCLITNGGVSVKKDLRVGGDLIIEGTSSSISASSLTVDDLTINNSVSFPPGTLSLGNAEASNLDINGTLTLNGTKSIKFEEGETFTNRRFFGWQSFSFARGSALNALHPYSFKNPSSEADIFAGSSAHVVLNPSSSDSNVAGIDEDGVFMPPITTQDNIVSASVVLEFPLNSYFSTAGSTTSESSLMFKSVNLLFKDTDDFHSNATNLLFCQVEIIKRQMILGLVSDLEVETTAIFGAEDLLGNDYSYHNLTISGDGLAIATGNLTGNICTVRVTLYNSESSTKVGPRFIGAIIECATNSITPS